MRRATPPKWTLVGVIFPAIAGAVEGELQHPYDDYAEFGVQRSIKYLLRQSGLSAAAHDDQRFARLKDTVDLTKVSGQVGPVIVGLHSGYPV